jgi:hypothetical protein
MNLLPVESAYTLMRISMEQLPAVSSAHRDELLVAIDALGRGFAHLIRGHIKQQNPQFLEFAGHAKAISDTALQLRNAWPSASHYQGMKGSVAYLLKTLVPLRGKRMFSD